MEDRDISPELPPDSDMNGWQHQFQLYREVIQTMTEGVVVQDADGNFTLVNPAAARLHGIPADEMVGMHWTVVIPLDQQPIVEEADLRRAQGTADRYVIEILHTDGTRTPVLVSGNPRYDREGRFIGTLAVFTDISDRLRAEEALKESEERFRTIVESTQAILVNVDTRGRFTYANEAAGKLLGVDSKELIGRLYLRYVHPEDRDWVSKSYLKQIQTGQEAASMRFRVLTSEGEVKWLNFVSNLIAQDGQIVKESAVALDITDRVQAEMERELLLAAEQEQRTLAETLRGVTLALTSQTSLAAVLDEILQQAYRIVPSTASNIMLLKANTLRIAGWHGYERYGSQEFMSSFEYPLSLFPNAQQAIETRRPVVIDNTSSAPQWIAFKETAWIKAHLVVPITLQDQALGLLCLDSDTPHTFSTGDAEKLVPLANAAAIAIQNARLVKGLEEQVAARTAEIESEKEKSEAILRNVSDAILMTDEEMRIVYANPAYTRLTGYSAEEIVGLWANEVGAGAGVEGMEQTIEASLSQGQTWRGEVIARRKDNRTYDATLSISPMFDLHGQSMGYVCSHEDISPRRELERARERFMTNISHQLRTPLTSIRLYANLLRKGAPPAKAGRYLQLLDEQAERLANLVQDILEMAILDSGQAVQRWTPINLASLIQTVVTRHEARAQTAGLTLVNLPIPDNMPTAQGDQARLAQALNELIQNAIDFTPKGGKIELEVGSSKMEGRDWLTISVRDTGPGIPPEEQERVFDRFFRGNLADSGHLPGTGLGLSMAQTIAWAHGGRITVESQVDQGSVLTLWLPAAG